MLGFPYSAILVFSAFGPVLYQVVPATEAALMSTVFLAVLAVAMVPARAPIETSRWYLPIVAGLGAVAVAVFSLAPDWFRWILLSLFGLSLGRVAVTWSRRFLAQVARHHRGRLIGFSLCVAYGILYLANVTASDLPSELLPVGVGGLLLATVPFAWWIPPTGNYLRDWNDGGRKGTPRLLLLVIFLIYMTAGFTYAGMFPQFAAFGPLDRYYNVLPFVVAVPVAGYLADRFGRLLLLYVGVAAVGTSLAFFQLGDGIERYLLSQTTVQLGWAFLDAYVWIVGADVAFDRKLPRFQNLAVATFLLGTVVGSSLTLVFLASPVASRQYFLWFLPLFAAVALMSRLVYERVQPVAATDEELPKATADPLTEREQEIALLLLTGAKNSELCERLFISQNTLKTHCRHIYRKLNVENRVELRERSRGRKSEPLWEARHDDVPRSRGVKSTDSGAPY
jgi:DNA-binding CsgD family transcriptional regulator